MMKTKTEMKMKEEENEKGKESDHDNGSDDDDSSTTLFGSKCARCVQSKPCLSRAAWVAELQKDC